MGLIFWDVTIQRRAVRPVEKSGRGTFSYPAMSWSVASKHLEGCDVISIELLCSNLAIVTTEKTLKERYTMKFCVKLNKTFKETWNIFKEAFGSACMSYSQAKKRHKSFTNVGKKSPTRPVLDAYQHRERTNTSPVCANCSKLTDE